MSKYAMVIDQSRCIGCMACIVACKAENDVPPEMFRTRVLDITKGKFPKLRTEYRSELCNHCDEAQCVTACPTGASYNSDDGTVQIDRKKCVGCKACLAACPYDARYINHEHGYADKCTFCTHRVEKGLEPACVATCVGRSRIFGDLSDKNSEVSRLLAENEHRVLLKEAGTKPRVYYINRYPNHK